MGNLVTKITTNSVELNESNVSDIIVYEVKKDIKTPVASQQTKAGLFKSMFLGPFDPRSPSTFITRTPIQIFRSASTSKFNHQELNESLNESVDLDILTAEEQESLNSNKDLVEALKSEEANIVLIDDEDDEDEKLPDPRSPPMSDEIVRTPIVINDELQKAEDNLMKKIAEKLISTKLANDAEVKKEVTKKKSKPTEKHLIFEDETENVDRFSTPPKKLVTINENERTPLSCLANKTRNAQPRALMTSTPKGSKIPVSVSREKSASRIPRRIE